MGVRTIDIAGLYSAERGRLRRLIHRLVGNRTTADDLVQQAFEKLLHARSGSSIENCPAYLTCTARNLAFNHLRNEARRSEVAVSDANLSATADEGPSPETSAIYRCELRWVLSAVAALPPRRREAFILNKFEGMSYDEIAARLGVSRNTVITHIVLALTDLNRRIGDVTA